MYNTLLCYGCFFFFNSPMWMGRVAMLMLCIFCVQCSLFIHLLSYIQVRMYGNHFQYQSAACFLSVGFPSICSFLCAKLCPCEKGQVVSSWISPPSVAENTNILWIFCEMLAWSEKKCWGHIELIIQIHPNNMSEYRWNVPSLDPIVKTDVMCQTYVGCHVSVRIDVYYIYSPFWAWRSVQSLECVMCYGHHREIVWLFCITSQRLMILEHHLHKSHSQILVANARQFGLPHPISLSNNRFLQ